MSNLSERPELGLRNILFRALLIIGATLFIVVLMPRGSRQMVDNVEIGQLWRGSEFTAPFDFPVYKSDSVISAERARVLEQYEPYFILNTEVEGEMVRKFASYFNSGLPGLGDDYISIIANRLHAIYQRGIMDQSDSSLFFGDSTHVIRVVNGKTAESVSVETIYTTRSAYEQLFLDETLARVRDTLQKCNLNDYITSNLTYDKVRSETEKAELLNNIPLATGVVQRGQKIIDQGEVVDERTYNILKSFDKENARRNRDTQQLSDIVVGQFFYVFILLLSFTLYLDMFRRDYFDKPRSVIMVYSLIVIFSLLTAAVRHSLFPVYLLPFAMLPIFVRVFLDSRTAFMSHVTTILICASMLDNPFDFIALETVAGLVAILTLRELSQRSQLFKTAVIVTIAALSMNLGLDLMQTNDILKTDRSTYRYIVGSGVLLLFTYPLMYLVEKAFGFISNITLIELSNTNNPLLRRLSEIAPGTFQHSIQVGNLAAEIAIKIGANSQLARTGALYHDIGKMLNPIYFTENQSGVNPHERLSYVESAQIIISHVTEGLKLADKYNLPGVIRDFISTHHGTGKAKYFYIKYKNAHPDENVDELLFTYPGPNPFTREQAVLMMCDTVEAASRSLKEYTDATIRELVNRLIDNQVKEGFFHDCPITFRDITYAKTVLIEKLKTIYHTRISYPEEKKEAEVAHSGSTS